MVGTCLPSSGFRSSNSEKKEYVSKGLQLVKQNSRLQGNAHNTHSHTHATFFLNGDTAILWHGGRKAMEQFLNAVAFHLHHGAVNS